MEKRKIKSKRDFIGFKNNKLNYKCKDVEKCLMSMNGLIKKFPNMHRFCNGDVNCKGVYPYENMNTWERFNEKSLPDKKFFTVSCI